MLVALDSVAVQRVRQETIPGATFKKKKKLYFRIGFRT